MSQKAVIEIHSDNESEDDVIEVVDSKQVTLTQLKDPPPPLKECLILLRGQSPNSNVFATRRRNLDKLR